MTTYLGVAHDTGDLEGAQGARVFLTHRDYPRLEVGVVLNNRLEAIGFEVSPVALRAIEWKSGKQVARPIPDDAEPLTARRMREIPFGELHRAAVLYFRSSANLIVDSQDGLPVGVPRLPDLERLRAVLAESPRPGRRGRRDREYAELSAQYVNLLERGVGTPTKELASKLHMSPKTLSNLLHEARRRDLLTEAPQGRAGGDLTERAKQLLEEGANDGDD